MKTKYIFTVLFLGFAYIHSSAQGIAGSAHDFTAAGWNPTTEICVVCHTPHNASTVVTLAPLWNHEVTVAVHTPYASNTLDATVGQPDGISKLCLSCHDGTVAIDNFGGVTTGTNFMGTVAPARNLGTDLTNDHPVSFTFDVALASADGGLFDPTLTNSGLGGTIDADMLRASKVQCVSCHEPHNKYGNNFLLRKNNTGSALCLTCHNK